MLVGSLAASFYGLSRSTKDADFVVQFEPDSLSAILAQLGPLFKLDRQTTFETITATTRHIIAVAKADFHIELFRLSSEPYDQQRFQRRQRVHLATFGCDCFILTAEDVVVTKLRWAQSAQRGKDREDLRVVISLRSDTLDWPYIQAWCDQHGTRPLLDEIRQSLPPL